MSARLCTLGFSEPDMLSIVFRGYGESVKEHQDNDQPVEGGRFHRCSALPATESVPASPATAREGGTSETLSLQADIKIVPHFTMGSK